MREIVKEKRRKFQKMVLGSMGGGVSSRQQVFEPFIVFSL